MINESQAVEIIIKDFNFPLKNKKHAKSSYDITQTLPW